MEVHPYAWAITVVVMVVILTVDVLVIGRRPHEPSTKEASRAIAFFVSLAVLFGLGVWYVSGGQYAGEFFAGWITEYSLSVDNLFIFLIIMSKLKVPRELQQFALLVGIILALIFRGIFIAVGAAAIERFAWVFFIFGAFLVYTAIKLFLDYRKHDDEDEAPDNAVMRLVRRRFNATEDFRGTKLTVKEHGKRFITPLAIALIAIGSADIIFAVDSIPAIFGLTQETYLVFAANAFSLLGLRQLFFLIDGLLDRLVYLAYGLAVILGFIGAKLVIHALHTNELPFINGGEHVGVPEIPTLLSLGVIIVTLVVTTLASLAKAKVDPEAVSESKNSL